MQEPPQQVMPCVLPWIFKRVTMPHQLVLLSQQLRSEEQSITRQTELNLPTRALCIRGRLTSTQQLLFAQLYTRLQRLPFLHLQKPIRISSETITIRYPWYLFRVLHWMVGGMGMS